MPYIKGAHDVVVKCFKELGIKIHFGTSFEGETTAKALDYSCIVDCRGYKFKGPRKFMTGDLANCLDKQNGQIQVNYFGQVCEKYPLSINKSDNQAGRVYENISRRTQSTGRSQVSGKISGQISSPIS